MLLLCVGELVVGEEEHVQLLCIVDLELVNEKLSLLDLIRQVLHWFLEHIDSLGEDCHV